MLRLLRPAWQTCARTIPIRHLSKSERTWTVVEKVSDRQVPPLSNVTINAVDCPVVVRVADPQQYADSDRLLIYLLKDVEEDKTQLQLVQATTNTFNIDVQGKQDEEKTLEVHVPVQSNVSAFCSGSGGFTISDLQSDKVAVVTTTGTIAAKNIKCSEIVLATQGGNVSSKGVLQGRINIKTLAKGSIECQRLQGPLALIESENGAIDIASDYCDKSSVTTHAGAVKFGSLHRKCKVKITGTGQLVAAGLHGSLQAMINHGSAEVQVSQLEGNSSIEVSQGSVKVKIGDNDNFNVSLCADNVSVPEDFVVQKSTENDREILKTTKEGCEAVFTVNVEKGDITLEKSSWIASLNLRQSVNK